MLGALPDAQYRALAAAVNRSPSRWALPLAFMYMVMHGSCLPSSSSARAVVQLEVVRILQLRRIGSQQRISMRQLSVLQCCLQVAVGVGMLAGSTVMLLTLAWGGSDLACQACRPLQPGRPGETRHHPSFVTA